MVGDAVLGEAVGPDPLGRVAGADQGPPLLGPLGSGLLLLLVEEAAPEDAEGLGAVLVLAPLVAADDDGVGRQVDHPDGAGGLVLVLAAGAAGGHGLDV